MTGFKKTRMLSICWFTYRWQWLQVVCWLTTRPASSKLVPNGLSLSMINDHWASFTSSWTIVNHHETSLAMNIVAGMVIQQQGLTMSCLNHPINGVNDHLLQMINLNLASGCTAHWLLTTIIKQTLSTCQPPLAIINQQRAPSLTITTSSAPAPKVMSWVRGASLHAPPSSHQGKHCGSNSYPMKLIHLINWLNS